VTPKERKALLRKKRALLKEIQSISQFIRGSVVVLRRPCSYKGCRRCKAGLRHPALYHTVSKHGKTQITYLGKSRAAECRRQVAAYKRLTELIEMISDLNLVLLTGKER
jgi:hypothetical protein